MTWLSDFTGGGGLLNPTIDSAWGVLVLFGVVFLVLMLRVLYDRRKK